MKTSISSLRALRSGFTLIESLVVISIIAVLAVLSFGALGKLRANERSTTCLSNMRQIGLALLAYTAENNTQLPGPLWRGQSPELPVDAEGAPDVTSGNLATFLARYTHDDSRDSGTSQAKTAKIFTCPAWLANAEVNKETICYYSAGELILPEGEDVFPFGKIRSGENESTLPARLANLPAPASLPALWEFDKPIARETMSEYREDARVPNAPVHKTTRTVLYFDAHVASTRIANQ